MDDNVKNLIQMLESEWSMPEGFLGRVREGFYDSQQGASFANKLETVKLPPGNLIDRRTVSLVWYIPLFLEWQRDRVRERGGDVTAFERFTNRVLAIVQEILGVP